MIDLNNEKKTVEISDCSIEHPAIFDFFKSLSKAEREEKFTQALRIGVIALRDDRVMEFLTKTQYELFNQMEALKWKLVEAVTAERTPAVKGANTESEIFETIREYLERKHYVDDDVQLTGASVGAIARNKTGDIVVTVNGDPEKRIVIEVKFDKGLSLGDFKEKDSASVPDGDTAISQMIEGLANRNAKVAIVVLDQANARDIQESGGILWRPPLGFVVAVDRESANFSNLIIALDLARSIVNSMDSIQQKDILSSLMERLSVDVAEITKTEKLLKTNHKNLQEIAVSIRKHALLVTFTKEVIKRFIETGQISHSELLGVYQAKDVKKQFSQIKNEIETLFPALLADVES